MTVSLTCASALARFDCGSKMWGAGWGRGGGGELGWGSAKNRLQTVRKQIVCSQLSTVNCVHSVVYSQLFTVCSHFIKSCTALNVDPILALVLGCFSRNGFLVGFSVKSNRFQVILGRFLLYREYKN